MSEVSKAGLIDRYIKSANIVTPSEDTLSSRQYERVRKLLTWHKPPSNSDHVDAIIVPTTSPNIDRHFYDTRIESTIKFAQMYPQAKVLFSGKRPDASRATEFEMSDDYSEAVVMAQAAEVLGLSKDRILLEEEAVHVGQNIQNSLDILQGLKATGILVISSGYLARRVDSYLKKEIEKRALTGVKTYTFDSDVEEDLKGGLSISAPESTQKRDRILYEAKRLSRYRKQGDL